jgi:hypothetical protein
LLRWRADGGVLAVCHSFSGVDVYESGVPPRGTVVVVGIFGALVVAGWLWFFFGLFLPRNTP